MLGFGFFSPAFWQHYGKGWTVKNSLRRLLLGLSGMAIALVAGGAYGASDVSNARIVQLRVDDNSTATISFDTSPGSGRPGCATYDSSSGKHLSLSLATDFGRETFKLASAAHLAGKRVRFLGSNGCNHHPNKEDLVTLYVY
jgi:hypothetical protein